jgi:hypothetical protein
MTSCYLPHRRPSCVPIREEVTGKPRPQTERNDFDSAERWCSMATVKVRIPKFRVTKSGRIVKTGTVTRHVHVRVRKK